MRLRAPASALLRRAQLTLMLVTVLPTMAMTAVGIVLLALSPSSVALVAGILVVSFCATALTGYILVSIWMTRGASLTSLQNQFLSAVSHELRTPLTSVQMFVETLKEERVTDPEERQKCLAVILQGLQQGERVVTSGNFLIDSESRLRAALRAP